MASGSPDNGPGWSAPADAIPPVSPPAARPLVVLFDGVCNLCERSVQFILRRDKKGKFSFASLQGPAGQALLRQAGLPAAHLDSFVLIDHGKVYTRSSAALRVLRRLGGGWSLLVVFWILPKPLRDWVYDQVARHRYQWFGKKEACWLPTPALRARFLD